MIKNRTEILRKEREIVLTNLAEKKGNRAKLLTVLMDIDDEMEQMAENKLKSPPAVRRLLAMSTPPGTRLNRGTI